VVGYHVSTPGTLRCDGPACACTDYAYFAWFRPLDDPELVTRLTILWEGGAELTQRHVMDMSNKAPPRPGAMLRRTDEHAYPWATTLCMTTPAGRDSGAAGFGALRRIHAVTLIGAWWPEQLLIPARPYALNIMAARLGLRLVRLSGAPDRCCCASPRFFLWRR